MRDHFVRTYPIGKLLLAEACKAQYTTHKGATIPLVIKAGAYNVYGKVDLHTPGRPVHPMVDAPGYRMDEDGNEIEYPAPADQVEDLFENMVLFDHCRFVEIDGETRISMNEDARIPDFAPHGSPLPPIRIAGIGAFYPDTSGFIGEVNSVSLRFVPETPRDDLDLSYSFFFTPRITAFPDRRVEMTWDVPYDFAAQVTNLGFSNTEVQAAVDIINNWHQHDASSFVQCFRSAFNKSRREHLETQEPIAEMIAAYDMVLQGRATSTWPLPALKTRVAWLRNSLRQRQSNLALVTKFFNAAENALLHFRSAPHEYRALEDVSDVFRLAPLKVDLPEPEAAATPGM